MPHKRLAKLVGVRPALVVAGATAVLAWGIGMNLVHAVMLMAGAAGITFSAIAVGGFTAREQWSEPTHAVRAGGRMDVAFQTWRLTGVGNTLDPAELGTVRAHVTHALLARGLDPADPRDRGAIAEVLGPRVTALLYPRHPTYHWSHDAS